MRITTLWTALRLPVSESARLASVWLVLCGAELSLRLWPLQRLIEMFERRSAPHGAERFPATLLPTLTARLELIDRHHLFRPSCLRKAIALMWLLHRRGMAATLRIGVVKDGGALRAHAWVDLNDEPYVSVFKDEGYLSLNPPSRVPHPASVFPS